MVNNEEQDDYGRVCAVVEQLICSADDYYGILYLKMTLTNNKPSISRYLHFSRDRGEISLQAIPDVNVDNEIITLEDFLSSLSINLTEKGNFSTQLSLAIFPAQYSSGVKVNYALQPSKVYLWDIADGSVLPAIPNGLKWGETEYEAGPILETEREAYNEVARQLLPSYLQYLDFTKQNFVDLNNSLRTERDLHDFFGRIFSALPYGNHLFSAINEDKEGAFNEKSAVIFKYQEGLVCNTDFAYMMKDMRSSFECNLSSYLHLTSFIERKPDEGVKTENLKNDKQEIRSWYLNAETIIGFTAAESIAALYFNSSNKTGQMPPENERYCDAWI